MFNLQVGCLLWWNIGEHEDSRLLRALRLPVQVQLLGQSISVGRPSGYVDPSRAQEAAQAAAAALQAFQAGDMQTMEAQLEQANLGVTASPAAAAPSPAAAGEAKPLTTPTDSALLSAYLENALKRNICSHCEPHVHSRCETLLLGLSDWRCP